MSFFRRRTGSGSGGPAPASSQVQQQLQHHQQQRQQSQPKSSNDFQPPPLRTEGMASALRSSSSLQNLASKSSQGTPNPPPSSSSQDLSSSARPVGQPVAGANMKGMQNLGYGEPPQRPYGDDMNPAQPRSVVPSSSSSLAPQQPLRTIPGGPNTRLAPSGQATSPPSELDSGDAAARQLKQQVTSQKPAGLPSQNYPWSTRQIALAAVPGSPTNQPPLSPFPRYGLTVPATPTATGQILIFGGLVREQPRNDLFSIDCETLTASLVPANGALPLPRVGHACALLKQVLIVWGGDTKMTEDDEQDEAVYLFNIKTHDWTRLQPEGEGPSGRYGHAACVVGTSFFVFGGQVEREFMNDLWEFDLGALRNFSSGWKRIRPVNDPPPARTGHVLIAYEDQLYLFGGTDGSYHYNDVWLFDLKTRMWTEEKCTGYIPVPREGHSACVVDDVIYAFGGKRWFMFANMGPSPTGRSGHAMTAWGKQVFVLGGEVNAAFAHSSLNNSATIHVLDTGKIKYPAEATRKPDISEADRKLVQPPVGTDEHDAQRSVSTLGRTPPQPFPDNSAEHNRGIKELPNVSQHRRNEPTAAQVPEQENTLTTGNDNVTPKLNQPPTLGSPLTLPGLRDNLKTTPKGPAPQRPPRADDVLYGVRTNEMARSLSPSQSMSPPPGPTAESVRQGGGKSLLAKRASLISQTDSRPDSPAVAASVSSHRSVAPTRQAPPSDAFYYGTRSPTMMEFSTLRPGSAAANVSALEKELENKDAELEAAQRRETALKAVLAKAIRSGFIPDGFKSDEVSDSRSVPEDVNLEALQDATVDLKKRLAEVKNLVQSEAEKAMAEMAALEASRSSAIEEAAYLRSRLMAMESEKPDAIAKIQEDRIQQLETHIQQMIDSIESDKLRAAETLERLEQARQQQQRAEHDAEEARTRAASAEDDLAACKAELHELHLQVDVATRDVRSHAERVIGLQSLSTQHETDRELLQTRLETLETERDDHIHLVEEAQKAITIANSRADDLHERHLNADRQNAQLQSEVQELRAELESKTREMESSTARVAELEKLWTTSREEADGLRSVVTGRLANIVDTHRSTRSAAETRTSNDKAEALTQEINSLRKMLQEAGMRIDAAQDTMKRQSEELVDLHQQRRTMRQQIDALNGIVKDHRTKLETVERTRGHQEIVDRRHRAKLLEWQARHTALRSLLADHGIAIRTPADNHDEDSGDEEDVKGFRELSSRLNEQSETITNLQARIRDLTGEAATLGDDESRSVAAASPDSRVAHLEQQMNEMETAHQKKVDQLSSDYQTALQYVKGTEKVFRKLKEQNVQQKDMITTLQSELTSLRGNTSQDAAARPKSAASAQGGSGRATPSNLDVESTRQFQKLATQHADLNKRFQRLEEEMSALREISAGREREVEITRKRALEAEEESVRLREELDNFHSRSSSNGKPLDDLEQENAELRHENEVLTNKIGLLLEMNEPGSARPVGVGGVNGSSHSKVNGHNASSTKTVSSVDPDHRRLSATSSSFGSEDHAGRLEALTQEMREWEQKLATPSSSQRRSAEES